MVAVRNSIQTYKYQRRQPEKTLLYRTIESHWPLFIQERARVNKKLPLFIHQEFDEYLKCGIPEFGFVRTYCYQCQYSGIVAFSCKRRGFCPSCAGKRMNDEANHIIKNVIPEISTRQWVLTFPYKIRYILAHNQKVTNEFLKIFIRTIESYQKRRIKNKNAKNGAITFIQRFGSALNLNVHFHTLMTDGVYMQQKDQTYLFQRLPHPTHDELQQLVNKIKIKLERKIKKLNLEQIDQVSFEEESLDDISQISIAHKSAFGDRQGQKLRQYGIKSLEIDPENHDPTTANNSGYSLNARVWIAYNKRKKLEQVIRYMARGPIAQERMSETYTASGIYHF